MYAADIAGIWLTTAESGTSAPQAMSSSRALCSYQPRRSCHWFCHIALSLFLLFHVSLRDDASFQHAMPEERAGAPLLKSCVAEKGRTAFAMSDERRFSVGDIAALKRRCRVMPFHYFSRRARRRAHTAAGASRESRHECAVSHARDDRFRLRLYIYSHFVLPARRAITFFVG